VFAAASAGGVAPSLEKGTCPVCGSPLIDGVAKAPTPAAAYDTPWMWLAAFPTELLIALLLALAGIGVLCI
jgi:hypothetical protein